MNIWADIQMVATVLKKEVSVHSNDRVIYMCAYRTPPKHDNGGQSHIKMVSKKIFCVFGLPELLLNLKSWYDETVFVKTISSIPCSLPLNDQLWYCRYCFSSSIY